MFQACTLLVMASIVASAPAYASGSCLSYGHSCWGAHGKRSGPATAEMKWYLSKLAPLPVRFQARPFSSWAEGGGGVSDTLKFEGSDVLPQEKPMSTEQLPPPAEASRLLHILAQLSRGLESKDLPDGN